MSACASYYKKNQAFMQAIYVADYPKAEKIIKEKKPKKKDILLFYLNKGTLYWMMDNQSRSNEYFQKADYYVEDYQTKYAAKLISFLSNPKIVPYGGEGFEQILIHYYTTLNHTEIGNFESALIEAKRMQIKLQKINDFNKNQNKYNKDAFAHLLLGVVYDSKQEYNNAFIAYRNALEIYEQNYSKLFSTEVPTQLKKDIIRTAKLSGFNDLVEQYERRFNIKYKADPDSTVSLFVFWNNGLGPIKRESSITLLIVPMGNGWYHLVNAELGIRITYQANNPTEEASLRDMKFIRMAFPKYQTRIPLYKQATISYQGLNYTLDLCQPINKIAHQSLEDRMLKEISEAAIRLLSKKLIERAASSQHQAAGLAIGITNLVTEQADTRNWQLLPHDILYTRIPISKNLDTIKMNVTSHDRNINYTANIAIQYKHKGGMIVHYQTPQFIRYQNN
jgi:hypothetical protein